MPAISGYTYRQSSIENQAVTGRGMGLQPTDAETRPGVSQANSAAVTNPERCQVDSIMAHFWTLIEPLSGGGQPSDIRHSLPAIQTPIMVIIGQSRGISV